jgi:hypothetical protein
MATKSTARARQFTYLQGGSRALSGEPGTQRQLVEATNLDAPDGPRVTYTPRPGTTPESELATLAAVYAFVIGAHEQKKAAAPATRRRMEVDSEERQQGQEQ